MAGMSKVQIIGNLGGNPEIREVGEHIVANFSVGVTDKWGGKETTTWFRCAAWNKQAEIAEQFLRKGGQVYVEGRIAFRTWENSDGEEKTSIEVHVSQFIMLGKRSDDRQHEQKRDDNDRKSDHRSTSMRRNTPARKRYDQKKEDDEFPPLDDEIPF